MRLIRKSALERDIAQGRVRVQHVVGGHLEPTADHECMRRLPEGTLEDTRKVRFAESHERAEIRKKYPSCKMGVYILTHLANLPRKQAPFTAWALSRRVRISFLAKQ
jgi:hypothetical protein